MSRWFNLTHKNAAAVGAANKLAAEDPDRDFSVTWKQTKTAKLRIQITSNIARNQLSTTNQKKRYAPPFTDVSLKKKIYSFFFTTLTKG
jgi:hypothetical protein